MRWKYWQVIQFHGPLDSEPERGVAYKVGDETRYCWADEEPERYAELERRRVRNGERRARDEIRRDCGLVRARGALGGVYWE